MILHRYFGRRFLMTFLAVFALFYVMMFMIDIIDQVRRFRSDDAGFRDLIGLTLLNIPQAIYAILPLIMIIASIYLFLALARSSELVVTRAAGRSALKAVMSPVVVAFLIGVFAVAFLNPLVAATTKQYEVLVGDLQGESSILALSENGLWLRQGNGREQTVISAAGSNLEGTELNGVTFITFGGDGAPERRIDADEAHLANGEWQIARAKVWHLADGANPEAGAMFFDTMSIPSSLTADQIRNSFGTPSSIPIWELPQFIARLQDAGFTARRHEVFFQMELALPFILAAMVLIAAGFTVRPQRGGGTGIMVMGAVLLSFSIYFLRNFAQILGETGQIPILLAAWAPPLIAISLALGLILHMEDG